MKKLLIFIALVFSLVICLSGCYPNKEMFEQENADRVTAKGVEMMQVWLDENMPDAKLEECTAFISWTNYDGNRYLTDYASGTIRHNGKLKVFTIHTVTGAVYFETDADTKQKLNEIVEAYFDEALEAMGIIPESVDEGYAFQSYVMAPAKDGDSTTELPGIYSFDFGLPADVEDLDAFVRNPRSRLPIYISKPEITVADTTDLSLLDLALTETLEEEYGLHIGSVKIKNCDQFFQKNDVRNETRAELWEYGCWLKADGFELCGRAHERKEVRNVETNEVSVSDRKVDPETDLIFEQTDYGYKLSLSNKDLDDSLWIRAYEGAEMLNYDFYCLDEKDYSPKNDPSKKGKKAVWQKQKDGSYVLTYSSDHSTLRLYDGDILVHSENKNTDKN